MVIIDFIKKKKRSIFQLFGSLLMLAVAAGNGIFLALYETNGSGKYVDWLHEYLTDRNYIAMYNYAQMDYEDDFINEYFYEIFSEKNYESMDMDTLKVEVTEKSEDKMKVTFLDEEGRSSQFILTKEDKKNYVFFNEWKLNIDDNIIGGCKIKVPAGFDTYVDGLLLNSENSEITESEGFVEYKINKIFKGTHTLMFKRDTLEAFKTDVIWNETNSQYNMDVSGVVLEESQQDEIKNSSQMITQLMYKAVFDRAGIDEVYSYGYKSDAALAKFTQVYDNMVAAIEPEDGSTLKSLNIVAFTNYTMSYSYPDSVNLSFDLQCDFEAKEARSTSGGARRTYQGNTTDTIVMHFVLSDGQWYCDDMIMNCIDYSKKEEEE